MRDWQEKRRQAEEWLRTEPCCSEHYKAAMEFLGVEGFVEHTQNMESWLDPVMGDHFESIVLKRLRYQVWTDIAKQDVIPVVLPRHEIFRHTSKTSPLFGPASNAGWVQFRMFAPVRRPA